MDIEINKIMKYWFNILFTAINPFYTSEYNFEFKNNRLDLSIRGQTGVGLRMMTGHI